jgi:hypothetical protein
MRAPEEEIRAYLRRFSSPPAEEVDAFIAQGRRTLLEKNDFLARLGDVEHRLAFLHKGIVRYHVVVPSTGDDVTKDFTFAPGFAGSFGSMVRGQPVRVAISAVEDCVVTLWPHSLLLEHFERHAEWQKLGRKVAEWLYVRKEDRELAFLLQSAGERHDAMAREFPPEIARVPQHLIASYLGITPESLSRLKRRR